jgi:phage tail-like protein
MAEEIVHRIEISGPRMSQSFLLPPGVTTIGRADGNNLVFVHPLVSRKHAVLTCSRDACTITDLGSTHGTMVNRERIADNTPVVLQSGDVVEIGAFRMVYERIVVGAEVVAPVEPDGAAGPVSGVEEVGVAGETAVTPPPSTPKPTPSSGSAPAPQPIQDWQTAEYVPLVRQTAVPQNGHSRTSEAAFVLPPGLSMYTSSYISYLPEIYRNGYTSFISRFLALLESILAPIEWSVDNFDLYLDPLTSPQQFLPWLANWFDITFDGMWSEAAQRQMLHEGHLIMARRGTAWSIQRTLEICTGCAVEIDDQNENLDPFTFAVRINGDENNFKRERVEKLINHIKPAHTSYTLVFVQ